MLLEKSKRILFEICGLDPKKIIIAGISGGSDSIAMLDMLVKLGFKVCVAHLNHQLRPTASRDADFVTKTANQYGLEWVSEKVDVKHQADENGEGIEEAARNARYKFLFAIAEQKKAAAVLTAHQADDQVETILQNILRGTGLNGLTGMQPCTLSAFHAEIPLIRPLLDCWREEILDYCTQENLEYVIDETNKDTKYRRNRIRHELIPQLQGYNPQIKKSLLKMGEIIRTDHDFINTYLREIISGNIVIFKGNSAKIDVQEYKQCPLSVQRILIKYVLEKIFPDETELGFFQYENARKFISREIKSTGMQLNDQITLRLEKGKVILLRTEAAQHPEPDWPYIDQMIQVKVEPGQILLSPDWKMKLDIHSVENIGKSYLENPDPNKAFLDADTLGQNLEIRKWQPGDRYQPLGMKSKRIKLSDFWINKKVPERAKKHWPLIFCGGYLVWIPGFQPSERAKITAKTRRILSIRVFCN